MIKSSQSGILLLALLLIGVILALIIYSQSGTISQWFGSGPNSKEAVKVELNAIDVQTNNYNQAIQNSLGE